MNMVTMYAEDINVDENEFLGLIKRYEVHHLALIKYRRDGGVEMDEKSALILKNAREDIKLPDKYRMNDIKFGVRVGNELSAALNNSSTFSAWRGYEHQTENDFRPWCTN